MEAETFLTKAQNSLKAAELCLKNGLYDDAVSRAYYAALRAAIALLLKIDVSLETKRIHAWVQAAFPKECVHRRKVMSQRFVSYISELQNDRNIADYHPRYLSKKTAKRALTRAKNFVHQITKVFENDQKEKNKTSNG
ncbi:HEPN domain-containing protein [candidate division KSB1 bacterium]|nr:HEPN domain-containing protein [candidate division KSB1 bacterium]NIR71372.1 HEPN domain-containing protein [candidate division KSB1 bacterium]NIS26261.1 HEPN domain-containing protein [candidate division KSB1 bacterium]NIT73013.1 HEPN domain-containing protein [candidate division KSB1 bacterium]NIU26910.1 HEPN domain-containing protein [candidate division KSB1 bacterium]